MAKEFPVKMYKINEIDAGYHGVVINIQTKPKNNNYLCLYSKYLEDILIPIETLRAQKIMRIIPLAISRA